jgi:hypothetical protein
MQMEVEIVKSVSISKKAMRVTAWITPISALEI